MTQQSNQGCLDELYKGSRRMIADLSEGRAGLNESSYDEGWNDCIDHLAQRGMILQEGWVAMPREPTEEIRKAWNCASDSYFSPQSYRAMLAAAPKMEGKE